MREELRILRRIAKAMFLLEESGILEYVSNGGEHLFGDPARLLNDEVFELVHEYRQYQIQRKLEKKGRG